MDSFPIFRPGRRTQYNTVTGVITEIAPMTGQGVGGCRQLVTVESGGNITNFVITPDTYVADAITLRVGMQAHFVYNADLPAILIYPPQYTAVAVVPTTVAAGVKAGFFDNRLVSSDNTLQLNVTRNVPVVTSNNQTFTGSPRGRYLLVLYNRSTRSIPAQTTPERVVVMCEW